MKSDYQSVAIGPGGRWCACCAEIPQVQKKLEHRKARRLGKRRLKQEVESESES